MLPATQATFICVTLTDTVTKTIATRFQLCNIFLIDLLQVEKPEKNACLLNSGVFGTFILLTQFELNVVSFEKK